MADAPRRSSGPIFRLQRLRRNVSEERSFLWNFQPISEENSQPSGSPWSRLCVQRQTWFKLFFIFIKWWTITYRKIKLLAKIGITFLRKFIWKQIRNVATVYLCPILTSTAAPAGSAALLRGRTSLLLRCTWYTFSAGTQDRGLSSGGMVTPYSQPVEYTHRHKRTITHSFPLFHFSSDTSTFGLNSTL